VKPEGALVAVPKQRRKNMKNVPERQLRNHELLAAIPAVQVAQIAATLLRDGGEEIEAIRKAYTLLDIAEHCNLSLKNEASVEAGIKSYREGVKIDDEFYTALENAPHYEYKVGPDGQKLPVPFDEGLAVLIPLPNSTKNKADVRMARFKRFVAQRLRENRPDQDEQERMIEAGERIAKFKRDGIDARFFGDALLLFTGWWKETYKLDQSEKGKRGQAKKRGKQGRVKSNSDKRKGARPPWEQMRPIIEATRYNLT
jgi:hypothetical protein